jgi:hypothetical protein
MNQSNPEWFSLAESATAQVMRRIADVVSDNRMALQVKWAPQLAHWFMLDALFLANQANRDGMHANALALTRQCIEAMSVIELGICGHPEAEAQLVKWEADKLNAGQLRAWLQARVWPQYGSGLWDESWATFMHQLAKAIQPYAHYGRSLAQWQVRLLQADWPDDPAKDLRAYLEIKPRAYDPQKATRITLFHAILTYALGRIWMATNSSDAEFASLINRLGKAIGRSEYLDRRATNWGQQFWAMVWGRGGKIVLE